MERFALYRVSRTFNVARLPRVVIPGCAHLIVHSGRSADQLFVDSVDRESYLDALKNAASEANVAIHAFGLTAHDVRLFTTPSSISGLATMIQGVGRRYVRGFNQRHNRSGTPWDGRFRSAIIDPAVYFLDALHFVEVASSVVEGVAAAPASSSLSHHLGLGSHPLITEHRAYWEIGNTPFDREQAYRRYIDSMPADPDSAQLLRAALGGWVLGSPEFVSNIAAQAGRRIIRLAHGRPRATDRATSTP